MGVMIANYSLFGGQANLSNVYGFIRNIQTNKEDNGNHTLEYIGHFCVNGENIKVRAYNVSSEEPFNDCIWTSAYDDFKTKLTEAGLLFVDE